MIEWKGLYANTPYSSANNKTQDDAVVGMQDTIYVTGPGYGGYSANVRVHNASGAVVALIPVSGGGGTLSAPAPVRILDDSTTYSYSLEVVRGAVPSDDADKIVIRIVGGASKRYPGQGSTLPDGSTSFAGSLKAAGVLETLNCIYGDESAASANTAKLQAALDAKRMVLTSPGVVYINDTLLFDSDTHIQIGMGVTVKMIAGTNKNLLRTRAYLRMRDTPNAASVELRSGEYQRAYIIGATAHGLSVGDYVWLNRVGAVNDEATWNGVHRVETITSATNFVVTIKYPFAGVFTFNANWVKATQNVTFDCDGTMDYNYASPDPLDDKSRGYGVYLIGTARVTGKVPATENCFNFAFYSLASCENRIVNPRADWTPKDGVKVYGPSFDDYYQDINFNANDDIFSVQAREPALYQPYQLYWGHVNHLRVNGIYGISTGASCCAIYGSNDAFVDFVEIENVNGYCRGASASCVRFSSGTAEPPNKYMLGLVKISKINASRTMSAVINAIWARHIVLSDIRDTYAGFSAIVETGSNVIDHYVVDKLRVKQSQGPTAFALVVGAETGGTSTHGLVEVTDATLEGTTNLLKVNASATIQTAIIVSGLNNRIGANPISILAANTPLHVEGAVMAPAGSSIVQTEGALLATFRRISGAFTSLIKLLGSTTYGVDLSVDESCAPTLSGGVVTHTNASATIRRARLPASLPVPLNAAWLSRTAGSHVVASANTGTGGATDVLANNAVVCDATGVAGSWKQVGAPTRNY